MTLSYQDLKDRAAALPDMDEQARRALALELAEYMNTAMKEAAFNLPGLCTPKFMLAQELFLRAMGMEPVPNEPGMWRFPDDPG